MQIERIVTGPLAENCYIIYDREKKEGIIADPGSSAQKIIRTVGILNIKIKNIVFTHAHFDHIMAYHGVREAFPEAELLIFESEKEVLEDPVKSLMRNGAPITADRYLKDGDIITFGDCSLKVIHTPGHTVGSICLYGDGILVSGDTLFKRSIGRWDLPTGNGEEEIASIYNRLFVLPDETVVYPGHGEETVISEEKELNEVLRWR